jgi:hypothetical protein
MAPYKDHSLWKEALKLTWSMPAPSEDLNIASYTLLRKTAGDSLFDVFDASSSIPSTIISFSDNLAGVEFPLDSYEELIYKIFATDNFGRSGDTSAACTLQLSSQPKFSRYDSSSSQLYWTLQGVLGPVDSWLQLWNLQDEAAMFSSPVKNQYGGENVTLEFSARVPATMTPLEKGTWVYAIFVNANGAERQSLKVGDFMVP